MDFLEGQVQTSIFSYYEPKQDDKYHLDSQIEACYKRAGRVNIAR